MGSRRQRSSKDHSDPSETDSDSAAGTTSRQTSRRRSQRRRSRKRSHTEPELHQSREEFIADWHITPEEEEKRVRELQARMHKEGLITHDMPLYYHGAIRIEQRVMHVLASTHTQTTTPSAALCVRASTTWTAPTRCCATTLPGERNMGPTPSWSHFALTSVTRS